MVNILFLALFVSLGGIITGYHNSSVNGILEMRGFQDNFPSLFPQETTNVTDQSCSVGSEDSTALVGLFIALSGLGCVFRSLFAGKLADIISRRYSLALSGIVMMLGSLLIACSYYNYIWMAFLGRILHGICIGALYVLMPVYIGEMSPKARRGMMISIMGPAFAIGIFIGLFTNAGFARFDEGWRIACGVLATGGIIYSLGFIWLPHTPRWLVMKSRNLEALTVLSLINGTSKDECFVDTLLDLEDLMEVKKTINSHVLLEFCRWAYVSRCFLMIVLFLLSSQVSTLIAYYPVSFFCLVGISQPFLVSIILGPIAIVASIISAVVIDKMGRKLALIGPGCVNLVVSFTIGILLHSFGSDNSVVNYAVVVLICLNTFFLFSSWAVVAWIIASEIFPLKVKGFALSAANSAYWAFTFIFNFTLPPLVEFLNLDGYLYVTGIVYFAAIFLLWLLIPETKGVSLEHVDELFHQSWRERISCGLLQSKKSPATTVVSAHNLTTDVKIYDT